MVRGNMSNKGQVNHVRSSEMVIKSHVFYIDLEMWMQATAACKLFIGF